MRIHLRANVAVGHVGFVDDEELFDGLGLFAHLLEHAAEIVDEVFLFVVERGLFLDGVLEGAHGGIVHVPLGETLCEHAHGGEALVGVALRLLKFCRGLADLTGLEIQLAQLKFDGEVGGVFLGALLGFGELEI